MESVFEAQCNDLALTEIPSGKGYALFIAVLPVFMMYKVPVIGLGVSTTMIIIGFFYAALIIFKDFQEHGWLLRIAKITIPFLVYLVYATQRSIGDMTNAIQIILVAFHLIAIATGAVNAAYLKRCIVWISVFAASLVMLQTVLYYALGVHLPCIISSLCLDNLSSYGEWISTGVRSIDNMYRPSAFFLEPSHFSQYTFVALIMLLFCEEPKIKTAGWISLGIVATTSGMGMGLVAGIWICYLFRGLRSLPFFQKVIRFILFFAAAIIIIMILYQIPFFQSALSRVFSPIAHSKKNYNAIWGRTLYWETYISPLNGKELIFGLGYKELPAQYFTGLMELIYCSGIVGVVFFYIMFLTAAVRATGISRMIALIICGLIPIANLTSFINMTYYIGVVVCFYLEDNRLTSDEAVVQFGG